MADPNTTKKFLPQLFMGSSRPPMGTVLVTNEISAPTPPGWGLGGPESHKWAIWGANKNKLSWIIFINDEILDQKPKLLIMKSWSSEVASDFWSGSFLVRQAQKTRFCTGVSLSGQKFPGRIQNGFYHPEPLIHDRGKHQNRFRKVNIGFRGVLSHLILGIFSFSIFFNFLQ